MRTTFSCGTAVAGAAEASTRPAKAAKPIVRRVIPLMTMASVIGGWDPQPAAPGYEHALDEAQNSLEPDAARRLTIRRFSGEVLTCTVPRATLEPRSSSRDCFTTKQRSSPSANETYQP